MSFGENPKQKQKVAAEATILPNQEEVQPSKSLSKRKIISKIQYGDISLREFSTIDCDGATIIEGIPNDTENLSLSLMISHFIVEQLKLTLIGELYSRSVEPTCVVERGEVSYSVRIYGNKNVIVFTSEYELSSKLQNDVVEAILDFGQRHKCKMILSVKGLETDPEKREKYTVKVKNDSENGETNDEENAPKTKEDLIKLIEEAKKKRGEEKLWFCTNDEEFSNKLIKMEHKPLQDVILSGVSAGLLAESCYTDMIIACLFSKLNELQKYISVDARAAIGLVVCISHLLGESAVIIDVNEMDKDVTKLEQSMIKIINRLNVFSTNRLDSHLYL
eukprot:gene6406-10413_t